MTAETTLRLAEHGNVIGIKEASGSLPQVMDIIQGAANGFAVLSGDDDLTLPTISMGGQGVVSVISNETPGRMSDMVRLALAGDFAGARKVHFELLGLMRANFIESNPVPVKTALGMMGLIREEVRSPLSPITQEGRKILRDELAQLELIDAS
jgi:4-hydroxy-tetrahydrodipicolinate synthase